MPDRLRLIRRPFSRLSSGGRHAAFTDPWRRAMPNTTLDDFTMLSRRGGLQLTDAQIAEIFGAWGYVEQMLERNRRPALAREAEPSHIFKPEEF
jgi:hypothetical protein